jgi:polysaccharide pyruvyl transferase WcaK-like protein
MPSSFGWALVINRLPWHRKDSDFMALSNQAKKICIFGANVGNLNLGDEATFAVMLHNIRGNNGDAEVIGVCHNPADTAERYHIRALPVKGSGKKVKERAKATDQSIEGQVLGMWEAVRERIKLGLKRTPLLFIPMKVVRNIVTRGLKGIPDLLGEIRFIARSFNSIRNTGLFIFAGGGVLSDHSGGVLNFPYSVVKWSILAKIAGAKLAFVSVGAGPIYSLVSRYLFMYSLSLADYRSFRDEESKRLIDRIGVASNQGVFPDLVYSMRMDSFRNGSSSERVGNNIVGINPFPHCDPGFCPVPDAESYRRYIAQLASFVLWLMEKNYRVLFFPTQLRADPPVIKDLKDSLERGLGKPFQEDSLESPIRGLDDLMSQISKVDYVVATRFHGILFSFLLNKPVLGLCNHPKMENLMRDMGQGDYLLNIDTLNLETLKERFISLKSNSETIKERLELINVEYRHALSVQYDQVVSLLEKR